MELTDKSVMSIHVKVLAPRQQTYSVVLESEAGRRMLLKSAAPIARGALIEMEVGQKTIWGEVVNTASCSAGYELWVETHHSINRLWEPYLQWRGMDVPPSVVESLNKLNRRLTEAASHSDAGPALRGPVVPVRI